MICLIRHKWGQWRPQESAMPGKMIRVCERCGTVKDNGQPGRNAASYQPPGGW